MSLNAKRWELTIFRILNLELAEHEVVKDGEESGEHSTSVGAAAGRKSKCSYFFFLPIHVYLFFLPFGINLIFYSKLVCCCGRASKWDKAPFLSRTHFSAFDVCYIFIYSLFEERANTLSLRSPSRRTSTASLSTDDTKPAWKGSATIPTPASILPPLFFRGHCCQCQFSAAQRWSLQPVPVASP